MQLFKQKKTSRRENLARKVCKHKKIAPKRRAVVIRAAKVLKRERI